MGKTLKTAIAPSPNALLKAVKGGNLQEVKELVARGADVNAKEDDSHVTPVLSQAILSDYTEIADFLIEQGANVNEENDLGYTPLIYAVPHNDIFIAEKLIGKGADVVADGNIEGNTPLMIAAANGYPGMIHFLAGKGAVLGKKNKHGRDALSYAGSHPETVQALREAFAARKKKALLGATVLQHDLRRPKLKLKFPVSKK